MTTPRSPSSTMRPPPELDDDLSTAERDAADGGSGDCSVDGLQA
jgi:hypothetical protein